VTKLKYEIYIFISTLFIKVNRIYFLKKTVGMPCRCVVLSRRNGTGSMTSGPVRKPLRNMWWTRKIVSLYKIVFGLRLRALPSKFF